MTVVHDIDIRPSDPDEMGAGVGYPIPFIIRWNCPECGTASIQDYTSRPFGLSTLPKPPPEELPSWYGSPEADAIKARNKNPPRKAECKLGTYLQCGGCEKEFHINLSLTISWTFREWLGGYSGGYKFAEWPARITPLGRWGPDPADPPNGAVYSHELNVGGGGDNGPA